MNVATGPVDGVRPVPPPARRLAVPKWTDTRLVVGVILVLTSVVTGSRVVAAAEQTRPVWAAIRELPPGTVLTAGDLRLVGVRVDALPGLYRSAAAGSPVGLTLDRAVGAGELIPSAALSTGPPGTHHWVSVPVQVLHFPPGLDRGATVDVYETPGAVGQSQPPGSGVGPPQPVRVLADANVVAVDAGQQSLGGVGADVSVVLDVDEASVATLVAAVRTGALDLVLVQPR